MIWNISKSEEQSTSVELANTGAGAVVSATRTGNEGARTDHLLPTSLVAHDLDGQKVLEAILATSPYRTVSQAIASLALFSHPETVRQTSCRPVIRVIRNAGQRGGVQEIKGTLVGLDDNKAPTDVFLWCNNIGRRPSEVQFNHVYASSQDPESYANLANLCITPSFLAKLTDTNSEVRALLRFRAWDLFGWHPNGAARPEEPSAYKRLLWAEPLAPVDDVAATFEAIMMRRPKDRSTVLARRLGTAFNGFVPCCA